MATYKMDNGSVLRTENATASWSEAMRWNGSNHISVPTGSQWDHQKLHRSRKGRYYIECWSQWQGSTPRAEWVSEHEAVRWLLHNNHEVPDELAHLADDIEE